MRPATQSIPPVRDLLLLAPRLPYPPTADGQLRAWNLLKFLSTRYRVHLGCFIDHRTEPAHLGRIQALCYETCFVACAPLAGSLRSLRALAAGTPPAPNATLAIWAERLLKRHPVRSALALSAPMARYLVPCADLRRVLDLARLESEQWRRRARACRWPLSAFCRQQARAMLACELEAASRCHAISFASVADAALFERLAPESLGKLACLGNGVDADYFSPHIVHRNPFDPADRTLVLAASLASDEEFDALAWFARHVFAPLRERHRALRLYIPGPARALPSSLRDMQGLTLSCAGADPRACLAHAALVVAPGPSQHGARQQILEAMAMQKVVVGTPQALDGLGREVLAAADARQFIAHIEHQLDGSTGRQLGLAARARVLADFSWNGNLARLPGLLDALPECAP